MRKTLAITILATAAAVALIAAAWGAVTGGRAAPAAANGSVQQFTALADKGLDLDYTPLSSPADAVRKADLIVHGTLVQVREGIRIQHAEREISRRSADSYATFVVAVDWVISGDAARITGGHVYVQVFTSRQATPQRLSRLNPGAKIVAVLDDISAWRPSPAARVLRPGTVPAGASLYAPYNDGLWLQGAKDAHMYGIGVEEDGLGAGWHGSRTVTQFTAQLDRAAQSN